MSYNNFIPTVWANEVQRERERQCIAAKFCNRDFEGEIAQAGDTVKILGVGRPTIGTYVKNTTTITPQNLQDQSTEIKITQADYFAFEVDDIDKRQAKGNLMAAQMAEAAAAMAESEDSWIYGLYAQRGTEIDCSNVTSATVLGKLMNAFEVLWGNKVPAGEEIRIEASPKLIGKIMLAKILHGMPNDTTLDKGYQGAVTGILGSKLYLANGIYNDGTYDYCWVRTKKAVGFANQLSKTEPYRPENSFSDAVKGLNLYGGKVVRPKELVVLKFSAGAETAI